VLFNASFGESIVSWGGGTATGPRQVTPAMPFFALALVFLPPTYNLVMGALAGISALYMLAAVSTNPHFPYEFDNPVWQFALPHYFRGDFSFNRDTYFGGPSSVIGDSVSFNLGKLIRLPGALQMVPLWLIWTMAATELAEDLKLWPTERRAAFGSLAVSLAVAILFVPPLTGPLVQHLSTHARHGLLARYYMGNTPGETPPHLIRVDQNIDFNNVAELGAMPFASTVVWTGEIVAYTPGEYQFGIRADDAGWVTIDDKPVIPDPGNVSHEQGNGSIMLSAGLHRITVGERNIAGDSSAHFYWQPPGGQLEIVPPEALIPERYDGRQS